MMLTQTTYAFVKIKHFPKSFFFKKEPTICCLQERPTSGQRTHTDWKAEVAILISDKIDFKTKAIKKDKERHYIMIKGSIQEEDCKPINIYAPNIGAPKYTKQILTDIKGETDSNTIIVGDFNTSLISMDRSSIQKINKATEILNNSIENVRLNWYF